MASRRLNDLDPRFRPLVVELIARAVEAKIDLRIIETRRSEAEHQENVKRGRSWTSHSKHIDGLAVDLCPVSVIDKPNWDPSAQVWMQLGAIAEQLGLTWGGSWKVKDCCHFESRTA